MNIVALIETVIDKGVRLWLENGELCFNSPEGVIAELLPELKKHKQVLLQLMQQADRDLVAQKTGLQIYKSGELYGASPSRFHEVTVENDEAAGWVAWAGRWHVENGVSSPSTPIRTWGLYQGKDFAKAVAEAVRFTKVVTRNRKLETPKETVKVRNKASQTRTASPTKSRQEVVWDTQQPLSFD